MLSVLLQVRPRGHFAFSHLDGAQNVPLAELLALPPEDLRSVGEARDDLVVVCRRGNDSATAVDALLRAGVSSRVRNLVGGLGGLAPVA